MYYVSNGARNRPILLSVLLVRRLWDAVVKCYIILICYGAVCSRHSVVVERHAGYVKDCLVTVI